MYTSSPKKPPPTHAFRVAATNLMPLNVHCSVLSTQSALGSVPTRATTLIQTLSQPQRLHPHPRARTIPHNVPAPLSPIGAPALLPRAPDRGPELRDEAPPRSEPPALVRGLGLRVYDLRFGVEGLGFGV
ncbi:hypothetical protein T484DRAFT_2954726 [Baffinella frigidus]|nr:hypothetical protein T484DRAFT_2954726 [Cryptophyta sp. CCMP2293]